MKKGTVTYVELQYMLKAETNERNPQFSFSVNGLSHPKPPILSPILLTKITLHGSC